MLQIVKLLLALAVVCVILAAAIDAPPTPTDPRELTRYEIGGGRTSDGGAEFYMRGLPRLAPCDKSTHGYTTQWEGETLICSQSATTGELRWVKLR